MCVNKRINIYINESEELMCDQPKDQLGLRRESSGI